MGGCSLKALGVTVENENVGLWSGILYNNSMFTFSSQHKYTVCAEIQQSNKQCWLPITATDRSKYRAYLSQFAQYLHSAHPPANTCLTSCGQRMNCKMKAVCMYFMFPSKSNELKHHTRMLVMQNFINKMKLRQNNINNLLLAYSPCFTSWGISRVDPLQTSIT